MAFIDDLLAKGPALNSNDLHEIEVELALMPLEQAHDQEPWIWEKVAQIVNDPDYRGDIPPIQ